MGRLGRARGGHVRYGMMMNAARSPEVLTVLLIDRSFNPLKGAPSTLATSKRWPRHPNRPHRLWADLCMNSG